MRHFVSGVAAVAIVAALGTTGAAAETVKVDLEFAPLPLPEATLTPSDFVYDKGVPVLFYGGMVIPKTRLAFTKTETTRSLTVGGTKCELIFDGKTRFGLSVGGKRLPLKRYRQGLAGQTFRIAGGRRYQLGMPRAFTFLEQGVIFCRSGCVRTGTIAGQAITLYDENLDGRYDAKADLLALGRPGEANVFAPVADYVATSGTVYKVGPIAAAGTSISLTRHTGTVGRIKLLGPRSGRGCFSLASTDGKVSFAAVVPGDASGRTLTVLPGKYRVLYGLVYNPATKKVVALVLPGEGTVFDVPAWKLPAPPDPEDKGRRTVRMPPPTTVSLGREIRLAYGVRKTAEKVIITGPVVPTGALGERYVGVKLEIRVQVVKPNPTTNPRRRARPTIVEIGRLTDKGDLKPAEHSFPLPTKDGKPLTGKCTLRLTAVYSALGSLAGDKPIEF